MNRDDIIGWMQEVGAKKSDPTPQNYDGFVDLFQRFAALAAEREREACAQLLESLTLAYPDCGKFTVEQCVRAIRLRSVNPESFVMLNAPTPYKKGFWDQPEIK